MLAEANTATAHPTRAARKMPPRTLRWLPVAWLAGALAGAFAGALAGCALEVRNTEPAKTLEREALAPGSVYLGWRVFQDRCARCHGVAATGAGGAPDLLPLVLPMSERRFVSLVLYRYDWSLPQVQAGSESAAREALIDSVLLRREGKLTMPAWQGEPRATAHVLDLYAYLSARAQGSQGPGRPIPVINE